MARAPGSLPGGFCFCRCGAGVVREYGVAQVYCSMNFQLIGVNHNSAPVEVRERLAIPEAKLPDAIRTLVQQPGVEEGMVLSTCNRVELLTSSNSDSDVRGFFRLYFGMSTESLNSHIYEFKHRDVVRHVFRVASSLH